MGTSTWTVFVGHYGDTPTPESYKKFTINKKVRMDSPPEFTATIKYDSNVDFNDIVTFKRDGIIAWKGFVEDMEISWDENGRYLNIGGRDMSFLLWRKYVENFNNAVPKTGGFFGTVSASELVKFLLRTPRSDLPVNAKVGDDCIVQQYQYNKEGWGIDMSRFKGLSAQNTAYGDINSTILRTRNLYWSNSGSQYEAITITVDSLIAMGWDHYNSDGSDSGISPYIDTADGSHGEIKSHINVNDMAEFSLQNMPSDATSINTVILNIKWKPDGSFNPYLHSDCQVQISPDDGATWISIGDFGGKGSVFGEGWHWVEFDISNLLTTVAQINSARVRFIETGALSTFITYAYFTVGYGINGSQTIDDWVSISFDDETIMGIYFESRVHPDSFPRNYKITCNGTAEDFAGYTNNGGSDITLSEQNRKAMFVDYNDKTEYLYINYDGSGDFQESFSFNIHDSQPTGVAFICPFCLSDNVTPQNYNTLLGISGPSSYSITSIELEDNNGTLTLWCRDKTSGIWGYRSDPLIISHNIQYYVKVERIGTSLRYRIFTDSGMVTTPILDHVFTDTTTYVLRYQALTYGKAEWATILEDSMDSLGTGEQVMNGDLESGDLSDGWANHWTAERSTEQAHSSTHSIKFTDLWSSAIAAPSDGRGLYHIEKSLVTKAEVWHYCPLGGQFIIYLEYDDGDWTTINVTGTGGWAKVDLLANWTDGKKVCDVNIQGNNVAPMYIDDLTIYEGTIWDVSTGTATRSTEPTGGHDGGACQKIHGSGDNQYYYFEKNLGISGAVQGEADGYVNLPNPLSASINTDLVPYHPSSIGPPMVGYEPYDASAWGTWGTTGSDPYLASDHSSYVWCAAGITGVHAAPFMKNQWSFDYTYLVPYGSFSPTVNSRVTIDGRIHNDGGGGSYYPEAHIAVWIWVQHATQWQVLRDNVLMVTGDWVEIFNYGLSGILTTLDDWKNAKIYIQIKDVEAMGGDLGHFQIQIGWIKLHAEGTAYYGSIDLMKFYNRNKAWSPSPDPDIHNCIAAVSAVLDSTDSTHPDLWKFKVQGYSNVGGTYSAIGTHPATSGTWYHLQLNANIASGTGGFFNLFVMEFSSVTPECQVQNIDNSSQVEINTFDFEVAYPTQYGNGRDTYLDDVKVQVKGEAFSTVYIYAGYGTDQILASATDNIYPDIIHSWSPQKINNLKIVITADDANHGWEISQVYVYKTDDIKYRVALDGLDPPIEEVISFNNSGYVPCEDTDIGKRIQLSAGGDLGELVSFDNDHLDSTGAPEPEWRMRVTSSDVFIPAFTDIKITNGIGSGETRVGSQLCYAGGPYITFSEDLIPSSEYSVAIGPINIPKNRLFDVLWDLCVTINDNYVPYEWWIAYDDNNTFNISNRRGSDKHSSISFVTGVNLGGTKYQKSSRDTYQRCQVIGSGEGNTQVNTSSFWESDEDAMDEIKGFIEDIVTQKQVTTPKIANRYAKVKLKLDASPKRKNAITCMINKDTYETGDYDVGDDVTITDVLAGLNGSFRIFNTKVDVDNNGEKPTLIVQAPYIDIGNIWTDIYDQLKQLSLEGVIAQDWAGEGVDTSKVSAEKLTTLFSVTAKNEETDTTQDPSTSPNWFKTVSPAHNAGLDSGSGNLSLRGGDSGGNGDYEAEARYDAVLDQNGYTIRKSGDAIQATDILVPADIAITQEPKFTCEFKIMESTGTGYKNWANNDYVEFGMFDQNAKTGFKFKVLCSPAGDFSLYAIYMINGIIQGTAKKMCTLKPTMFDLATSKTTSSHKYKAEIITSYNSAISTVTLNIYDEEDETPANTQISAVFININPTITVRPIYLHVNGTGSSNERCIMNFYDIKCQRDVI